jgi:hypothetical protein
VDDHTTPAVTRAAASAVRPPVPAVTPVAAPAVPLRVPVGVDLVHAPVYARPDLCALVVGNDFKLRAHLVCYLPTAAVPVGRTEIADLGQLTDPAVRDAAADILRLWESRPDAGPDDACGPDDAWVDAVDAFNESALHAVAGPTGAALRALRRLGACRVRVRRAPGDGYAPSLELTGCWQASCPSAERHPSTSSPPTSPSSAPPRSARSAPMSSPSSGA